ncbi:MAG: cell division control protein 6 [Firmicutes bacterium ADurb.Bin193]|nr:MAG: cell division control protein 6 [Firmicutes bacterium ADurb.Bin193]
MIKTYIDDKLNIIINKGGNIMLSNPYTPGAGTPPSFLAGRDNTIEKATNSIIEILNGSMACHTIYYGVRGVGKTVLLNKIESLLTHPDIFYEHIECEKTAKLSKEITIVLKKIINRMSILSVTKDLLNKAFGVLRQFTITYNPNDMTIALGLNGDNVQGIADTGDFSNDLTDLFIAVGNLAKNNNKCICIFLDEIQDLQNEELNALIRSVHRTNQLQLPIIIIGAGLPTILRISGEAKSYSERLFNFQPIDSLEGESAISALIEPAKTNNITYTKEAVNTIIERTGGYPYFIQEYGQCVWDYITNNQINIDGVDKSYPVYLSKLDNSFFNARYSRTTQKEKEFLFAMEKCVKYPCLTSQVANYMNTTPKKISLFRNNLIIKGLIYSPSYGEVDFTVPQFDLYLKRIEKSSN